MFSKRFIVAFALNLVVWLVRAQEYQTELSAYDRFLNNYVSSGLVDYKLIKENKSELDSLWDSFKHIEKDVKTERKSYLINLYNLAVIRKITDNYPVNSPKSIASFFDSKFISVNSSQLSLNELEHLIRKTWSDPRIHFSLVCGAKGCPPLMTGAFKELELEKQLTERTIFALNDVDFIKVDNLKKAVFISEIFNWYKDDFTKEGMTLIDFINKYKTEKIDKNYEVKNYEYNWEINELKYETVVSDLFDPELPKKKNTQDYTPSVLYTKGQWEYKFFNNLYSQTKGYDANGNKIKFNNRGSYFSSINQVLFGVNSRLNIGLDFWIKSVRIDDTTSSPFKLLSFESGSNSRTALSGVGPKIKFMPFKKLSHLSVQTTFLFPIAKDQEGSSNGKPYLSADSYISITQIFYDQAIGKKFQLFFQLAPWIYMKQKQVSGVNRFSVSSPADIFLSYFPTKRITLYFQQEFWPNFGSTGISSWFRQEGIGAKYQLIKGKLEAEASYTYFSMGRSAGAGSTYNFGLRLMHL